MDRKKAIDTCQDNYRSKTNTAGAKFGRVGDFNWTKPSLVSASQNFVAVQNVGCVIISSGWDQV